MFLGSQPFEEQLGTHTSHTGNTECQIEFQEVHRPPSYQFVNCKEGSEPCTRGAVSAHTADGVACVPGHRPRPSSEDKDHGRQGRPGSAAHFHRGSQGGKVQRKGSAQ